MPNLPRTLTALAAASASITASVVLAATPAHAGTPHRGTVYLHATRTHGVAGPSTIRPGVVRLDNNGSRELAVISARHASAGRYELAQGLDPTSKSASSRLFKEFDIRSIVEPHHAVYLNLRRSTLYVVDINHVHHSATDIKAVRVTGRTVNAVLPAYHEIGIAAGGTLHATTSVRHGGLLHVQNHSTHLQEIILTRVGPDESSAKVNAFLAHPSFERLAQLQLTGFTPVAVLSGHRLLWAAAPTTRGRYIMIELSVTSKNFGLHKSGVRALTVN